MPNGIDGGFNILAPIAKKISNLNAKIPDITGKRIKILAKKTDFLEFFDDHSRQIYWLFAVISIVAIIFDFILSNITMKPLPPKDIATIIKALIFSIIDCGIAVLASGIFAKTIADKIIMRKKYRIILWALCIIKIFLFLFFISLRVGGKINIPATIFMIALVVLVYVILDWMGSGLALLFGNIKYWILDIWFPDTNKLNKKLANNWQKLKRESARLGLKLDIVAKNFGLIIPKNFQKNGGN